MANPEETFDPNDLESIDALLDEAELEAVSNDEPDADGSDLGDSAAEDEPTQSEQTEDLPEADAIEEEIAADEQDDILDSIDDLVADAEDERADQPQDIEVSEPEPEVVGVSEPVARVAEEAKDKPKVAVENEDAAIDNFLEKRAAAQAAQQPNLSVEDMDAIKKLIIIFGSILMVLVITGIGIGVWSALAASSAGVDDDTKTLIESIKVASEQNGAAIKEGENITKSVEKKLDAINFSLEQLASDLAALETNKKESKEEVLDPLGLGNKDADKTAKKPMAKPMQASTSVIAKDPEVMKKLSTVSRRLINTQRRIDEINKRIKAMQGQSSSLAQSIKLIEKEALITQSAREEKQKALEEKMKKSQGNPYRYSAPDGGFYDQSSMDSYP